MNKLSIFNPWSDKYHTVSDFKKLSGVKQAGITVLTLIATIASVGILSIPTFRILVGRFTLVKTPTGTTKKVTHFSPSQISSVVPPTKISSVGPKGSEDTNCKGSVCIVNTYGSYFGNERLTNPKFLDEITSEEGDSLQLEVDDIFISFKLFDCSPELVDTSIMKKSDFFLPAKLFEGKKEGDKVRFRHNGSLVELIIGQTSQQLGYLQTPFDQLFVQTLYFTKRTQALDPKLKSTEGTQKIGYAKRKTVALGSWCKLGDQGVIYRFEDKNGTLALKPTDIREFPQMREKLVETGFSRELGPSELKMEIEFPHCKDKDIQVILNNDYLIFYAPFTSRIEGDMGYVVLLPLVEYFKGCTLDEVKEKLSRLQVQFSSNSVLSIEVPFK